MSNATKKRQQEAESSSNTKKILLFVLIVVLFIGAFAGGRYYKSHKYDSFAKCLASKQAKMYGLFWCPHCADQEAMFEASFKYVPYVECGVPGSRDEAPLCKEAGIKHFPTWQFEDGERREGTQSLQSLGLKTGCSLP